LRASIASAEQEEKKHKITGETNDRSAWGESWKKGSNDQAGEDEGNKGKKAAKERVFERLKMKAIGESETSKPRNERKVGSWRVWTESIR
jgi:hypothetical protein